MSKKKITEEQEIIKEVRRIEKLIAARKMTIYSKKVFEKLANLL